jgi:apolipoprotein D and lipocalin family protein
VDEKEADMNKLSPESGRFESLRRGWRSTLARAWAAAGLLATAALTSFAQSPNVAATPSPIAGSAVLASLQSLPALEVPPYMGTWYQVALYPNVFQRQCVTDTMATYRQLPDGTVEVKNRCRIADGRMDEALGQARPTGTLTGTTLAPARLEVSFLPAWLRWLPVGWGRYWVIQLAEDGRYAVISEPTREYLWILSRQPRLSPADEAAIRSRLAQQGFADLSKLQMHRHTP